MLSRGPPIRWSQRAHRRHNLGAQVRYSESQCAPLRIRTSGKDERHDIVCAGHAGEERKDCYGLAHGGQLALILQKELRVEMSGRAWRRINEGRRRKTAHTTGKGVTCR